MSLVLVTSQEINEALEMASQEIQIQDQVDESQMEVDQSEMVNLVARDDDDDIEVLSESENAQGMEGEWETIDVSDDEMSGSSGSEKRNRRTVRQRLVYRKPKSLSSSGRPRDPVRTEFEKQSSGKVKCKSCNIKITDRVDIMKGHQRVCKGIKKRSTSNQSRPLPSHSANQTAPIGSGNQDKPEMEAVKPTDAPENCSTAQSSASSGKPIKRYFDTVTAKQKHDYDIKVAKMIYACNLPFRIVSNEEFKDFVKALRPAYDLPSEREVANELLDEVFSSTQDKITEAVSGKEVVIMQDGWSTKKNQPLIAHSLQIGSKNFFYNAISTGTNSKTAEYLTTLLFATIDECQDRHNCKVVGVVTDSCSTMTAMRSIVESQRPSLFVYGCNAHFLNNVGVKVTPLRKLKDIIDIQKYFKQHHFQSAVLDENDDGKRPVLPCKVRWNSQLGCIQSFLDNHAIYLDTVRKHPKKFTASMANLVKDLSIYEQALIWRDIAKPVSLALKALQSDSATLSDAVKEWIALEGKIQIDDEGAQEYFWEKYHEALSPVALSAYILDPRYRGKGLSPIQMEQAFSWLGNIHEDLVVMAIELEAKNPERFPSYLLKDVTIKKTDPKTFWTSVENHGYFDPICCQVARRLQLLPAGASGIERCFSTMGAILTPKRNNLGVEKASRLCTVHQSLRFLRCEHDSDGE